MAPLTTARSTGRPASGWAQASASVSMALLAGVLREDAARPVEPGLREGVGLRARGHERRLVERGRLLRQHVRGRGGGHRHHEDRGHHGDAALAPGPHRGRSTRRTICSPPASSSVISTASGMPWVAGNAQSRRHSQAAVEEAEGERAHVLEHRRGRRLGARRRVHAGPGQAVDASLGQAVGHALRGGELVRVERGAGAREREAARGRAAQVEEGGDGACGVPEGPVAGRSSAACTSRSKRPTKSATSRHLRESRSRASRLSSSTVRPR